MPTVLIKNANGSSQEFQVQENQVLFNELEKQGVKLPYGCLAGACGSCKIEILNGDMHVTATSKDYSLIVLPLEYSHCLEFKILGGNADKSSIKLFRADGVLTGILFYQELNALIKFRIGPFINTTCRFEDYIEMKNLIS